jgi:hypothetical protein
VDLDDPGGLGGGCEELYRLAFGEGGTPPFPELGASPPSFCAADAEDGGRPPPPPCDPAFTPPRNPGPPFPFAAEAAKEEDDSREDRSLLRKD